MLFGEGQVMQWQKKKDQMKHNNLQNTTQKTTDWAARPTKMGVKVNYGSAIYKQELILEAISIYIMSNTNLDIRFSVQ